MRDIVDKKLGLGGSFPIMASSVGFPSSGISDTVNVDDTYKKVWSQIGRFSINSLSLSSLVSGSQVILIIDGEVKVDEVVTTTSINLVGDIQNDIYEFLECKNSLEITIKSPSVDTVTINFKGRPLV